MQVAIRECRQKHETMNAMTYGRLKYVLLVATAGSSMTVLAIPVDNPDGMQVLREITQVMIFYWRTLSPKHHASLCTCLL